MVDHPYTIFLIRPSTILRAAILSISSSVWNLFMIEKVINGVYHVLLCFSIYDIFRLMLNPHYYPLKSFQNRLPLLLFFSHLLQDFSKQLVIMVSHSHLFLFFGGNNLSIDAQSFSI